MARKSLILENVAMGYERPILEGVSIKLEPGTVYGLIGENSIGKSTFLKTAAAIIRPLRGKVFPSVEVDDWDTVGISAGVMIQEELGVFEEYSVKDVLERVLPRRRRHLSTRDALEALSNLIDVDRSLFVKPFRRLSGGERRLAAISVAVAGDPDCLILDEIFGGLDTKKRIALANNIKNYAAVQNSIIILADHDLESGSAAGFVKVPLSQWRTGED